MLVNSAFRLYIRVFARNTKQKARRSTLPDNFRSTPARLKYGFEICFRMQI